jgi:hypothetical protein
MTDWDEHTTQTAGHQCNISIEAMEIHHDRWRVSTAHQKHDYKKD